ncbi:MFS transporter [Rarobacter incanus]|uniref:Nitrate/nitrite transporter NarK n=1 Tax=Rarobacter incanus TaxID=153494 RepID=A0A542SPU8_9MICO|nr:MFS transporter [Rarobacter incanus]TQK76634.1 nitrate/nitrite transporter NarK [Rarobacter incanus]
MTRPHAPSRAANIVLGTAIFAYIVAVAHRSSFGVASLEAIDRFQADATTVSLFAVVQIGVYAAAQLPVGIALDRFGPRRVITTGAVLMTIGQIGMALASHTEIAIAMRVLVGLGDATTFVGAVRLIPAWFPARRVPILTQITGIVGQLGQVITAFPFLALLHSRGWTVAFMALAGLGVGAAVATCAWVRDSPTSSPLPATTQPQGPQVPSPESLRDVLTHPGTWLGFWTHLVTSFSLSAFTLMWGYPFLVSGQGLAPSAASWLLTWSVIVAIGAGPLIGEFTARHPLRRSWGVLAIAGAVAAGWLMVLLPSGPRPMWVLITFITLISLGGPGSVIGFDFARSFTPPSRLGSATGIVNVGGFVGSMATVLAVGVVLDRVRTGATYTLDDFRQAFVVVLIVWAIGMGGVLLSRRATRSMMATRGVQIPPLAEVWARRGARRDAQKAADTNADPPQRRQPRG